MNRIIPETVQEIRNGVVRFSGGGLSETVNLEAFSNRPATNSRVKRHLFDKTGWLYSKNIRTGQIRFSGGKVREDEAPLTFQDFCMYFRMDTPENKRSEK